MLARPTESAEKLGAATQPAAQAGAQAAPVIEIGIDSFAAWQVGGAGLPASPAVALQLLLERMVHAEACGLDVFGIGEHHRAEFLDSAPAVLLAAAAARTKRIQLTSAVTVLSAADPVRVFQEFATLDLLSQGRAEIVAGRGSFVESFPLFGLALEEYDSLFAEKLELLLQLREQETVHWQGRHRAALTGQGVYPRPMARAGGGQLPIWLGVGGTPASFVRAGEMGLPLMVAIIGGETHRFRPLVDLYRRAGERAGFGPQQLRVGVHSLGYVAEDSQQAANEFFPGYARTFSAVGRERGWLGVTRAHYDALLGPTGALLVGSPAQVAEKMLHHAEALGGLRSEQQPEGLLDRFTFQMDVGSLPHGRLMRAMELIGSVVRPALQSGG